MIWAAWFAPIVAALIAVIGIPAGLRIRTRRGRAIRRMAERLAWEDSWGRGYAEEYDKYLDHYLGGQEWHGAPPEAGSGEPGTQRTLRRWRGAPPQQSGS
jgi:hypothetical protein